MKLTRREAIGAAALAAAPQIVSGITDPEVPANVVAEWAVKSHRQYGDPFNETDVDAVFTGPGGRELRVPAFWAGGQTWRFRFAHHETGEWTWRTVCSDPSNAELHGKTGTLRITPYQGSNPLLLHGPVRVAASRRHFEHADGTPFFFLGDDWWLGMTRRLRWPHEFRTLALDRKEKGFTVIKLTAGLNTDTHEFDPRSENEGGQPWEVDYARINPAFFDWADLRIAYLVDLGISPSVVGSWGFYLKSMGIPKMCRHWRYCVARWGAYPVTWYLAMENDLPFYGSTTGSEDTKRAQKEWTEVGRYLRGADPFRRPISMQSWSTRRSARGGLHDPALLDFDSLHMGHRDIESVQLCVRVVRELRDEAPLMPVLPGEVCFEGIGWQNWQNVQRWVFWGSILGGSAGFCYGANGIWQFNRTGEPFGGTAHGSSSWAGDAWDTAMSYAGSRQIGLAKRFLARYPFWRIEPHQEWLDPAPKEENYLPPYAGGIPGELRLVYVPFTGRSVQKMKNIEAGVRYRAFCFDPVTGEEREAGTAEGDAAGEWPMPSRPGKYDSVLVLEKV